jgi:RNA polymerase sigma factor (sigma-70 family)
MKKEAKKTVQNELIDIDNEELLEEIDNYEDFEEEEEEVLDEIITPEDEKEADEVLDEILQTEGVSSSRDKIPRMNENDIFNVEEGKKLTCFIDGYLITIDDIDARLLNKLQGKEREDFLNNIKAKSNEKLIYTVANRLLRFETNRYITIEPEELYAAGWHALAKAIKTFDPSKKLLFTTYSYRIIMNEMIQEIKRIKKKIKQKDGDEVTETLVINISMETPLRSDNNGNSIYVSDVIADTKDTPAEAMAKDDLRITIMQALDMLDATEKFVMTYRYGLDRDIKLTQKEIANKLCQSQANISKIEKNCRAKLRIFLQGKVDDRLF